MSKFKIMLMSVIAFTGYIVYRNYQASKKEETERMREIRATGGNCIVLEEWPIHPRGINKVWAGDNFSVPKCLGLLFPILNSRGEESGEYIGPCKVITNSLEEVGGKPKAIHYERIAEDGESTERFIVAFI